MTPPGPGTSPFQPTVNQQIEEANSRLAANLAAPHAGVPEQVTNPTGDDPGVGVSAHTPVASTSLAAAQAVLAAHGLQSVPGLDVSGHQPTVNWTAVVNNGAQFAYVKATEGTGYRSPTFNDQYSGSYNAGLIRGAYHYAIPNNSTGAAQADFFVANGGGWSADGRTLPGMLDIEWNPYGSACYGLTQAQMVSWIASFNNEYDFLTGRLPTIYTATSWWTSCTGNSGAFGANSPLHIANYSGTPFPLPNGWPTFTIWQFADSGIFPGDQNLFNGNSQALVRFALGGAAPNAVPQATVAAEGADGAMWVQTPQLPSGWQSLGGRIIAAPAVVAVPQASGLASPLFIATATDHSLWIRSLSQNWTTLTPGLFTSCLDNPGAVVTGPASTPMLTVACQGSNRALFAATVAVPASGLPTVAGWTDLGGALGAGPAVAPVDGIITYFVTAGFNDGQVWTRTNATNWVPTPWFCVGHPAAGIAQGGETTWFGCQGSDLQLWAGPLINVTAQGGAIAPGPALAITSEDDFMFAQARVGPPSVWFRTLTADWAEIGGIVQNGVGAVGLA